MNRFVVCALVALLATCVRATDDDRKQDAAITRDSSAADVRVVDAIAAAPTTCREIRVCIFQCGENAACAGRCVSSAPAVARAAFEEAQMCSLRACPTQDIECRCDQECFVAGSCTELVEICDDANSDPFCDGPCH